MIIENTLWERISSNGRASRKLFEKIVLTQISKQDARIKELEEELKEYKQLSNGLGKKLQSLMILYSAPRGKKDEYYYLLLDALDVLKFYEAVDKNDEFIVGAKARDFLDKPEIKAILEEK